MSGLLPGKMIAVPIRRLSSVQPARALAALALGTVSFAMVACSSGSRGYVENTYPVSRGHFNHPVVIGQGHLGVNNWTLRADQDGNGQLCIGIAWHPSAGVQDFGCGFGSNQVNDEGRGTEPTSSAMAKDGSVLAFGPSPAGAVQAVLTMPTIKGTDCHASDMPATTVAITYSLPSWYPVHGAGWFATSVPASGFDCVIDVKFLDPDGRSVKEPSNF